VNNPDGYEIEISAGKRSVDRPVHKGTAHPGTANPNAKIKDPRQIVMLREYRRGGWSHADLAFFFGISPATSSLICRGKSYKDVGGPIEGDHASYSHTVTYRKPDKSDETAEIMRLRRQGLSHQVIADELGISKSKVGSVLRTAEY
jgi:hypothetical protein